MSTSFRKVIASFLLFFFTYNSVLAGNIDTTDKWAWGSHIGWINFGTSTGNVTVSNSNITGYAWSTMYGWINLDPTLAGINNTCSGDLTGHAWSGMFGYVDFSGALIDGNGYFQGQATIPSNGNIVFQGTNFSLRTSWLPTCDSTGSLAIVSPLSGSVVLDSTPLINGNGAAPGSNVIVTGLSGQTCTALVDGGGNWNCSLSGALLEGLNTVSATEILANGDALSSDTITLTVDTLAPLAPTIIDVVKF